MFGSVVAELVSVVAELGSLVSKLGSVFGSVVAELGSVAAELGSVVAEFGSVVAYVVEVIVVPDGSIPSSGSSLLSVSSSESVVAVGSSPLNAGPHIPGSSIPQAVHMFCAAVILVLIATRLYRQQPYCEKLSSRSRRQSSVHLMS